MPPAYASPRPSHLLLPPSTASAWSFGSSKGKGKTIAIPCSRRSSWRFCVLGGESKSPRIGSSQETSRASTSQDLRLSRSARRPNVFARSLNRSHRILFVTPLPFTCSNKAPTFVRFSCCSAIAPLLQRQNISALRPTKSARHRVRWICCLVLRSEEHTSELQSPMYLV